MVNQFVATNWFVSKFQGLKKVPEKWTTENFVDQRWKGARDVYTLH